MFISARLIHTILIVCMDESPKQLISETRVPIQVSPGQAAKYDYEYKRCGMSNIFLACEPLAGKRMVKVTERKTALDWACFMEEIAGQYEHAEKITVVMDNLITHNAGSFYEKFPPDRQRRYGAGLSSYTPRSMAVG